LKSNAVPKAALLFSFAVQMNLGAGDVVKKTGQISTQQENNMLKNKVVKGILGVSAVAALFAALAVHAQSTGTQSGTQGSSTQGNTGQSTSGQPAGPGISTQATAGQSGGQTNSGGGSPASLSRSDRQVIMDLAMANMAEIEAARAAQTKSQNEQVRNFAQQMIDDHTKALDDVRQLAQARGVTLPTELDRMHKAKADRLASLSGEAFDRAYMAQSGVADHKKAHDKLSHAQSRAKDPEVKALAARTLPVVDQHLNSAQQLHKSTAVGSSRSQGATESSGDKPKSTDSKSRDPKLTDPNADEHKPGAEKSVDQ
jgi:putative membrane protein